MSPRNKGNKGKARDEQKSSADSPNSRHVDAVNHALFEIYANDDIKEQAAPRATEVFDKATVMNIPGREIVGNDKDIQTSERLAEGARRLQSLEEHMTDVADRINDYMADHDRQFGELRSAVQELKYASRGYRDSRHRFLDVYRRKIEEATKPFSCGTIRSGEVRAHGGDCVSDAELYECGERDDEQVFIRIYSLACLQVRQIAKARKSTAIRALNEYGTYEVDTDCTIPDTVKAAFKHFCAELTDNPSTSLNHYDGGKPHGSYMEYRGRFLEWRQQERDRVAAEENVAQRLSIRFLYHREIYGQDAARPFKSRTTTP